MAAVFRILSGGIGSEGCLEEEDYRSYDSRGWSTATSKEVQSETRFTAADRLQETGAGKFLGSVSLQPDRGREIDDLREEAGRHGAGSGLLDTG